MGGGGGGQNWPNADGFFEGGGGHFSEVQTVADMRGGVKNHKKWSLRLGFRLLILGSQVARGKGKMKKLNLRCSSLNAKIETSISEGLSLDHMHITIAIANNSRSVIFMPYYLEVLFLSFFFFCKCKKIRIKRKFTECLRDWTSFELS